MPPAFEEWLAFLSAQLPQPVAQDPAADGSIYFTGGHPGEVIVRLTRSTITVWEYAVRWEGPHTPIVQPIRIGSLAWRHIAADSGFSAARALMHAALESRRSKFRVCVRCEKQTPPEWMHDDEICQSCAERHVGVVY